METLARRTLADQAYDAILAAIVRGDLAPGARIRDRELGEQLGISRTPVREALRRLADEGLVHTAPNASTTVAPVDIETAAEAFPVVAALHALATRLAVPALTRAELERMEAENQAFRAELAAGRIVQAIEADDRFHGVLVKVTRNRELERAIARVMPKIRRLDLLHFTALAEQGAALGRTANDAILDACRRGAAQEAADLVEACFLRLGDQVAELLARS